MPRGVLGRLFLGIILSASVGEAPEERSVPLVKGRGKGGKQNRIEYKFINYLKKISNMVD